MSLHELAALSGVSLQNIWGYEMGRHSPTIENAFRLASALGVTVDRLFCVPYKRLARDNR